MTEGSQAYPLVEAVIARSRLSWYWATVVVIALLALLLILAASFDGVLTDLSVWEFWQTYLDGPVLITYIIVAHIFMWRLRNKAIQAFRPLLSLDDNDFNRLAAKVSAPKRRGEWTSMLIGVGMAAALGQPWNLAWGPGHLWLSVFLVITSTFMNGLLAWLIYDTVVGVARIAKLSRQDLKFDILLDTELLMPIARWSLGISLVWIGGISISLIFQTSESMLRWQSITLYAILVSVTALAFLLSMWSAHNAVASVKQRELALARRHLAEASRKLKERTSQGQFGGMEEISSAITSWATYRQLVQDTPTWPFNVLIIRRLLASTIVPIIVYFIKVFSFLGIRF